MPPLGATTIAAEVSSARVAKPLPKKSPNGTWMAGWGSWSQWTVRTRSRSTYGPAGVWSGTVIQMCRITPGPSMSARVRVPPAGRGRKARPLRPGPSGDAAVPPAFGAPSGFSAVMARLTTPGR